MHGQWSLNLILSELFRDSIFLSSIGIFFNQKLDILLFLLLYFILLTINLFCHDSITMI